MYQKFLFGEKVYLREVREDDVTDEYYSWLNDPEINQFLETRFFPRSKKDIINHVLKLDANPNEIFLAICDIKNDKHVGNIKIGPINWYHRKGDLSFLIGDKNYWGKGFGTEAVRLVIKFTFEIINLHKITAGYYENNVGSAKIFRKCNFSIEGTLIDEAFSKGHYINVIKVGLLNKDD